ncbi:MAG: hypothetical protein QME51_08035, partial [Planctomycetota bacterium]|nr:hypothetical protein [Planctomycetota bacterium]
ETLHCVQGESVDFVNSLNITNDIYSSDGAKSLKALEELIEYQSITPTLQGVKMLFSLLSLRCGSGQASSDKPMQDALNRAAQRIKLNDDIIEWFKTATVISPNPRIRSYTLEIIRRNSALFEDDRNSWIVLLRNFLYDPEEKIRIETIKYLAMFENDGAIVISLLSTALGDGSYKVRKLCLSALQKHLTCSERSESNRPVVINYLLQSYNKETSMTLRFEIENILVSAADIADDEGETVRNILLDSILSSPFPSIRAMVYRVIGKSDYIRNLPADEKEDCINILRGEREEEEEDEIASRIWALTNLGVPYGTEKRREDQTPSRDSLTKPDINRIRFRRPDSSRLGGTEILAARFEPLKTECLTKYGGDERTETAVKLGLEYLAREQEIDGSWNCVKHNPWHEKSPVPQFTNEDELVDVSVTGLSLLCFLTSGSTHLYGPYQDVVKKGLDYIISAQDKTGCINIPSGHIHNERCLEHGLDHGPLPRRYNHNISTLVLVETYAMTGDDYIKDKAQKALEHSRNRPEKGYPWSFYLEYTDIGPGIFYILALSIARQTDLIVHPKEIERTRIYLERLTDKKSGRIIHIHPIPICFGGMDSAATGIFAHLLMGSEDRTIFYKAADWLRQFPPQWEPFYQYYEYYPDMLYLEENIVNEWHWYYQTLAFRHLGADYWQEWNQRHKEVLLRYQRRGGLYDGSWDPEGPWATIGGRVYSTAFSILSLQAYYSYLIPHH